MNHYCRCGHTQTDHQPGVVVHYPYKHASRWQCLAARGLTQCSCRGFHKEATL